MSAPQFPTDPNEPVDITLSRDVHYGGDLLPTGHPMTVPARLAKVMVTEGQAVLGHVKVTQSNAPNPDATPEEQAAHLAKADATKTAAVAAVTPVAAPLAAPIENTDAQKKADAEAAAEAAKPKTHGKPLTK